MNHMAINVVSNYKSFDDLAHTQINVCQIDSTVYCFLVRKDVRSEFQKQKRILTVMKCCKENKTFKRSLLQERTFYCWWGNPLEKVFLF